MGMYSRHQGPLTKPSGRTKTVEQAMVPSRKKVGLLVPVVSPEFDSLESCERAMAEGFQRFAFGLATIRDQRYYLKAGYTTFDDYCEAKLGWTRSRADQFANAHFTVKTIRTVCRHLITNEAQARALSEVPKAERTKVLERVANSGPVTATRIREVSGNSKPKVIDVEPEPTKSQTCPTCKGKGVV